MRGWAPTPSCKATGISPTKMIFPHAEKDPRECLPQTSVPTAPSSTCISPPLLPEAPRAALCTLRSHAHLQVCRGEASPALGSSPQRVSYTTTAQIYHQQLSGGIWGETASAAFHYQDNFHFHFLACWCLACCQHWVSAQQARLARTTAAGGFYILQRAWKSLYETLLGAQNINTHAGTHTR